MSKIHPPKIYGDLKSQPEEVKELARQYWQKKAEENAIISQKKVSILNNPKLNAVRKAKGKLVKQLKEHGIVNKAQIQELVPEPLTYEPTSRIVATTIQRTEPTPSQNKFDEAAKLRKKPKLKVKKSAIIPIEKSAPINEEDRHLYSEHELIAADLGVPKERVQIVASKELPETYASRNFAAEAKLLELRQKYQTEALIEYGIIDREIAPEIREEEKETPGTVIENKTVKNEEIENNNLDFPVTDYEKKHREQRPILYALEDRALKLVGTIGKIFNSEGRK